MTKELEKILILHDVLVTSDSMAFRLIVDTAKYIWEPLHSMPATYLYMGSLVAWKKWHMQARLNYNPDDSDDKNIQLQATVADQVQDESIMLYRLLTRAAVAYPETSATFAPDTRTVIVESSSYCSRYKDEICEQVRHIFGNFIGLINDEFLLAALEMSGAKILGAPVDAWDRE